ncbi:homocysteine-responsive endoplasmic reticulum-resident ubiquitin-like domain member 2 protein isoform X2 [Gouania willdenowi]|uniref:homocysteine-responsive endoplasmic reticulum-resident ubiquitin-like domain member 2 protein isoform X2 n=1 Tax=Gouania willdenowi TaxID=441366 RepID=UPI001054BA59|nr:homocysteine-responsive endoplasmic reticulum-resident ubiquitin-like domain member 2 protein isoform X2 [Gouania willdenowi]
MDQAVVDGPVTLVIRAPNQKYDDQTINCCQDWTVEKLKAHLADVYPCKPSSKDQRLVYSGKLLLDHFTLKDVLRKHDEYHMLHLVCASRTPPSSPKPPRSCSNKPQESAALQNSSTSGQSEHFSSAESSDTHTQQTGAFPYHQMYPHLMHSWNPHSREPAPHTNAHAHFSPMSFMWWQQLYAWNYYTYYQSLAASSQHLRPRQPQHGGRHGNPEVQMIAQRGEVLNEDELHRDWLDWVYTFSRTAILGSIVYYYSSFSRFVMVMLAMLVLYMHQAGWFPVNLEIEVHFNERANQDEVEREIENQDIQEMEGILDDGSDDDDGDSGEDEAEDPDQGPNAGFLSSTWSFLITFFMSLIPEGPQNAVN